MEAISTIINKLELNSSYEIVMSAIVSSIRILDTHGQSISDEKEQALFYQKIGNIHESYKDFKFFESEKDLPHNQVKIRNTSIGLRSILSEFDHIQVEQITSTFQPVPLYRLLD